jgi:hypothetical protein
MTTVTAEAAVKEITLKPETVEMSDKVRKNSTIEHKKGDATAFMKLNDSSFYAGQLEGIGLTVKNVEDLQALNALVAAGGADALRHEGESFMKKHKEVTRIEFELPTVRKDGFTLSYDRSRTVPSRGEDGTMGTATQYGAIRVSHRTYAEESVGELKKVKMLSVASAAKVLAD